MGLFERWSALGLGDLLRITNPSIAELKIDRIGVAGDYEEKVKIVAAVIRLLAPSLKAIHIKIIPFELSGTSGLDLAEALGHLHTHTCGVHVISMTEEVALSMARGIERNAMLTNFKFEADRCQWCDITGAMSLVRALANKDSLQGLELDCGMTDAIVSIIAGVVKRNTALRDLSISVQIWNDDEAVGDRKVAEIVEAAAHTKSLRTFELQWNVGYYVCYTLRDFIQSSSLSSLKLHFGSTDEPAIIDVVQAIGKCRSLETLSLALIENSDTLFREVVKCLGNVEGVKDLYLEIPETTTDTTFIELTECLLKNKSLKRFCLLCESQHVGDIGISALAHAIRNNIVLEELELGVDYSRSPFARALIQDSVEHNAVLQRFKLNSPTDNPAYPVDDVDFWSPVMQRNRDLRVQWKTLLAVSRTSNDVAFVPSFTSSNFRGVIFSFFLPSFSRELVPHPRFGFECQPVSP